MKPRSLAQRMFLIAALALLPAVVIVAANAITLRGIRTNEIHVQALRSAELAALEMERILSGTESILRVIVTAPIVRNHDAEACSAFFARILNTIPYLSSLSVIDPDGRVWCSPSTKGRSLELSDRPYFRAAMEAPGRTTGLYTVARETGRKVLPIALRYVDAEGAVEGVVAGYIDLDWLQTTIEERTYAPGSSLTIADSEGRILARTPEPERFVGTVIPDAFQRLVRADTPGTEEVLSQDGTRRIIGYFPASVTPTGIYISSGISADAAFAPVKQLATTGVWISLVGMLAALLLASYTSKAFIVRPFDRLIRTIDAWRGGKTEVRTRMTSDQGEIGRVGIALDSFMDELLESRAARQKAENQRRLLASELDHRIKNLLTLIQVVARQTFAESDAKEAVAAFGARLKAMAEANQLLLEDRWQAAPLLTLVQNAVAPFQGGATPRFRIEGPNLLLSSGSTLAIGMALHELCTNAAKYGALSIPQGRVDITWTVEGDRFALTWAERNGPPVTATPTRSGFGSKLIKQVLEQKIHGEVTLAYPLEGLVCTITAPVTALLATEAPPD